MKSVCLEHIFVMHSSVRFWSALLESTDGSTKSYAKNFRFFHFIYQDCTMYFCESSTVKADQSRDFFSICAPLRCGEIPFNKILCVVCVTYRSVCSNQKMYWSSPLSSFQSFRPLFVHTNPCVLDICVGCYKRKTKPHWIQSQKLSARTEKSSILREMRFET